MTFSDDGLDQIVDIALKIRTGARGLRAVVERILREEMFALRRLKTRQIVGDAQYVIERIPLESADERKEETT